MIGLLTACTPASETDYVEQASQQVESKDYQAAIISLKNAIQINPENPDTRMQLGQIYARLGNLVLAEKELYRAVELKQVDENAVLSLFRIYHLTEDLKNTQEVYKNNPSTMSEDGSQLANIYFAIANLKQGERETGLARLKKAANTNKKYSDIAQALIHVEAGEAPQANAYITQQLLKTPDNLFVIYNAAHIYFLNRKMDLTVELFKKFSDKQPLYHPAKLFLANAMVENNNFDEASDVIKQILKVDETQPYAHYLRSIINYHQRDYEAAKTDSEYALSRNLNSNKLNLIAGLSNFELKNYEQAYNHLQKVPDLFKDSPKMNQIITFLRLQLGYTNEAADQLLAKSELNEQDSKLLTSVGYELIKSGDISQAEALIQKAESAEDSPSLLAQTGLLKLYLNDKSGIEDFERSIELDPDNKNIKKLLVSTYIEDKAFDKAIELATQWQTEEPDSIMALNALGTAYGLSGQAEKAQEIFDKALEIDPKNAASLFYKTSRLVEQQQYDKAEQLAQKMIEAAPTYLPGLRLYRYVMLLQDKANRSLKKLKDIKQSNPDNASVKYYYVSQLMQAKQYNNVIKELESDKASNKPDLHYNALGDAYLLTGQYSLAEDIYKAWKARRANSPTPVLKLINMQIVQSKYDKALSLIQNYLVKSPDSIHFRMLEIEVLIEKKALDQAKTKLAELNKLGNYPSATKAYEGKIAFYEQRYEAAESGLKSLYKLKSSSENALLLFTCYKRMQQDKQAIQFLYDHLEKVPSDLVIRQLLAEQFVNSDPQKAVDQYTLLTKYNPKDSAPYNNIAWLVLSHGDPNKALEYSSIAYDLAPNNVEVIDTHSLALYRTGSIAKAQDVLTKGIKKHPDVVALKLNLANILIKDGKAQEAKALLTGLKSKNPTEQKSIENMREGL